MVQGLVLISPSETFSFIHCLVAHTLGLSVYRSISIVALMEAHAHYDSRSRVNILISSLLVYTLSGCTHLFYHVYRPTSVVIFMETHSHYG